MNWWKKDETVESTNFSPTKVISQQESLELKTGNLLRAYSKLFRNNFSCRVGESIQVEFVLQDTGTITTTSNDCHMLVKFNEGVAIELVVPQYNVFSYQLDQPLTEDTYQLLDVCFRECMLKLKKAELKTASERAYLVGRALRELT